MPRENQKRGRRADAPKRKRTNDGPSDQSSAKRTKYSEPMADFENSADYVSLNTEAVHDESAAPADDVGLGDRPFYGVLEEQEQEYFKRADEMLELNQFASAEERHIFVHNLQQEASGKELKLACSQSCSRLLERLLALSGPEELSAFFKAFQGQFANLIQHRFASHCCEMLIQQCSRQIAELRVSTTDPARHPLPRNKGLEEMESLMCAMADEFEDGFGYLMTDKFGSHVLRIYLAALAGMPTDITSAKSLFHSKKKEDTIANSNIVERRQSSLASVVPPSFEDTLAKIVSSCSATMDTSYLRALSTHPTGNPTLQLLAKIQFGQFGKKHLPQDDLIINKLLSDTTLAEGSESASFVLGLAYDPVGSRLLEVIVEHAPGKVFRALYRNLLKTRMAEMAKNDVASYVVCRVLERLSPEDVKDVQRKILPTIPLLAQRGRTTVLKVLAERIVARGVDSAELSAGIGGAFADDEGNFSVAKVLELPSEGLDGAPTREGPDPASQTVGGRQHAAAAFLRSLLKLPGTFSTLVLDSLSGLSTAVVQRLATTPAFSPVLQDALTTPTASLIFRRKMCTKLYGTLGQLALSASGSWVVDALEVGSRKGLAFVRERVAEELAENEEDLRRSVPGRKVWRNWRMDLYQRNRGEWVRTTRRDVGNDGFQSLPGLLGQGSVASTSADAQSEVDALATVEEAEANGSSKPPHKRSAKATKGERQDGKTPLQRARERHARKTAGQQRQAQNDAGRAKR